MCRRMNARTLSFLAMVLLGRAAAVGGELATPLQTQSIPMSQLDWGPGVGGVSNPLVFGKFDPSLGTLDAISISMSTTIRNDFLMSFVPTPIPTTIYLATTRTTDPSILSNPALVQQLTDGPAVTLYTPDGRPGLFSAPSTSMPVDVVHLTESSGTWSSLLPVTDPHYIAPDQATLTLTRTLDAATYGWLLGEFIGTGAVDLPITAMAYSSFYTDSGNGAGAVLSRASATVTLEYWYHPFAPPPTPPPLTPPPSTPPPSNPPPSPPPPSNPPSTTSTPEPSGIVLLGLGAALTVLASRRHRAGARRSAR